MSNEKDSPELRLLAACDSGDVATVKSLLHREVDVNAKDDGEDRECALYRAAKHGYVEVVKVLLQHRAIDVDMTNGRCKWSALMVACQIKCLLTAQLLLDYGANVNIRGKFGVSALFIASRHGSIEAVKLLLIHEADVNVQDSRGRSVLMTASEGNYTDVVKVILEQRAKVNIICMKDVYGWSALMIACHHGHTETVGLLLKHGADVNDVVDRWSALMIASRSNKTTTVQVLLEYGANVNEQVDEWSALMIACHYGYSELAKFLLEQDANVNLQTKSGRTALMIASQQGHTAIVMQLPKYGADVNMREDDGLSALMIASQNGHANTAELLLIRGAHVNIKDPIYGKTALIFASEKGYTKTIEVLLEYGANVNMQDSIFKISALMNASAKGYSKSVKKLLKYDADVNMLNESRESPLMYASYNGCTQTAKLLLKRGADVNTQAFNGATALFYAYQKVHHELATLLLLHGASLDFQNFDGQTSLILAILIKNSKTVEQLLGFWAKLDIQDKSGQTALIIATENGDTETIKLLIKAGANINIQNRRGCTALMIASEKGYVDIASILLFHKADTNVQDEDGWTALMLACQHGNDEIVKELIVFGSDVNLAKNDGWTALTLARTNHHTDTVELLIKNGAVDAVPKKKHFYHMYTSTYTATGTEDSGYGPSAEQPALSQEKVSNANSIVISLSTSEQCFNWEGYGLHLYIPEGALPLEIEACTISIEASVEGNYIYPENCYPVSAIYWFRCVPKCKSSKPITLEIQHCAKQQNLQTLSFVKARSVENQSYIKFNKALGCCGTNHGIFPSHSSYGFIQLDCFCGYGVVQESSEDRQYRANLYYLPQSVNQWEIHFTVLWNTDAHHSVIENFYLKKNAEVGPHKPIEFDSESVCLDIPKTGVATEDDVWKILPLVFPPEVTKKEVDSFKAGKRIPVCQLQAVAQRSQHHDVANLIHPLKLLGTKTLHDYITLFRSSSEFNSTQHPGKRILSEPNLNDDDDDDDNDDYYDFAPNQGGPYHPSHSKNSLSSQYSISPMSFTTIPKDNYQLGAQQSVAAPPSIPSHTYLYKEKSKSVTPMLLSEMTPHIVGAQQSVAATPNLTMMTPPVMPPRTYKDNGKSAAQNLMLLPQTSSRIETPVTPLNSDPFQVTFQDPNLAQAHPIGPLQTLRPHSKATATVTFPLQYPQPPQKSIRGKHIGEPPQGQPQSEALQEVTYQHSNSAAALLLSASKPGTLEGDLQNLPVMHIVQHSSSQSRNLQERVTATFQHTLTAPQARVYPEPPRYTTLLNELTNRVAAKWEEIGSYLQLESGLLEIIKKDNPNDCRACLREMLKEWMKQVDPPPSWSAIIKAVKDCGYRSLARTLTDKYC